ncbi:ribosome biogenesis GTP-binding protein YihA/YsxC [bacterium]|nr:ribosome biogenesis GTP-binding protein YihA/YsxC [bacterium]
MIIKSAEFITSAVQADGYPETGLPEVAFIGRSNVGKSSLINNLVRRKKLAKTSSVPGKTQTINFYAVNESMGLVDLPGYGFTKAPQKVSRQWRRFIDEYLGTRDTLLGVIQLIDIRHPPTLMDQRVCIWLCDIGLLASVCVVKADKLTRNHQNQSVDLIKKTLNLPSHIPLIPHSAHTGLGKEQVWMMLSRLFDTVDEP